MMVFAVMRRAQRAVGGAKGRGWARLAAGALVMAAPVAAHAGTLTRDGFAFPSGTVKIVMFRPDVTVGSLDTGGIEAPNPDWTAAARDNMQKAFGTAGGARDAQISFLGEPDGDNAQVLNDYRNLFKVVSGEILAHGVFLDRLPTKQVAKVNPGDPVRYSMDWSLGPEAARLKAVTGADYALFVLTHDAYGSAGRKTAQIFGAMLGIAIIPGVHMGYAGLVDLNTGNLVWFNADLQMGGDLREATGADKRVEKLLRGFPARPRPGDKAPDWAKPAS